MVAGKWTSITHNKLFCWLLLAGVGLYPVNQMKVTRGGQAKANTGTEKSSFKTLQHQLCISIKKATQQYHII